MTASPRKAARLANDDALVTLLADMFATRAAGEWEHLLTPAGVACVEAFEASHSEFTCTDPVLRETGLVVEVDHPAFDTILRAGPPVALSETPGRAAAGCLVGQHTDQILEELGYSTEQVEELKTKQVVFGRAERARLTPALLLVRHGRVLLGQPSLVAREVRPVAERPHSPGAGEGRVRRHQHEFAGDVPVAGAPSARSTRRRRAGGRSEPAGGTPPRASWSPRACRGGAARGRGPRRAPRPSTLRGPRRVHLRAPAGTRCRTARRRRRRAPRSTARAGTPRSGGTRRTARPRRRCAAAPGSPNPPTPSMPSRAVY